VKSMEYKRLTTTGWVIASAKVPWVTLGGVGAKDAGGGDWEGGLLVRVL
jgi:hypothetical protein